MEMDTNTNTNSDSNIHQVTAADMQQQSIPQSFTIRSFSAAISALKQHTFVDVPQFEVAANMASELYQRTYEVINTADISNLQAAHSTLDPHADFLAFISTLHASLAVLERDSPILPALLASFTQLVQRTDSRWARAAAPRWIGASRHVTRLAIDTPDVLRAISLISTIQLAADKLISPNSSTNCNTNISPTISQPDELVPLHADFLALCIHAKYYRHASRWIRAKRRLHVNPSVSRLSATDVHLIYHYATWILTGIKDFTSALQTCRLALVIPAPSPGTFFPIVITTYRMYVLLHLLVHGKCPDPLKFSSYQTGPLRKVCAEYIELGHAFESNDLKHILQIVENKGDTFTKHETLGLVKQVVNALYNQMAIRLSSCYVNMTLKQVAEKMSLKDAQEAQQLLTRMIQDNGLNATINLQSKVVKFFNHDSLDEDEISQTLSKEYMKQCLDIMNRLQLFIEDVECDPEYIKRELAGQSSRKQSTAGARAFAGGGAAGLSLGVADIEAEFMR